MGMRVESGAHYSDNACIDDAANTQPPEIDQSSCQRAMSEEAIAGAACVGSALWTLGSLPSVLGGIGGAMATAAACAYAALKSGDADAACGTENRHIDPALAWSSDSS
jgi:hypothetical protein